MLAVVTATNATIALVVVFFVVFPLLAHGLIGFAAAQAMGEREENREYEESGGATARAREARTK
jgi:hypothetical protein